MTLVAVDEETAGTGTWLEGAAGTRRSDWHRPAVARPAARAAAAHVSVSVTDLPIRSSPGRNSRNGHADDGRQIWMPSMCRSLEGTDTAKKTAAPTRPSCSSWRCHRSQIRVQRSSCCRSSRGRSRSSSGRRLLLCSSRVLARHTRSSVAAINGTCRAPSLCGVKKGHK